MDNNTQIKIKKIRQLLYICDRMLILNIIRIIYLFSFQSQANTGLLNIEEIILISLQINIYLVVAINEIRSYK